MARIVARILGEACFPLPDLSAVSDEALLEHLPREAARHEVVAERLDRTEKATGQIVTDLRERLVRIDEAQKKIGDLSTQVVSLQEVLSNKQARGAFGEVQLNDLVQSALPPQVTAFSVVSIALRVNGQVNRVSLGKYFQQITAPMPLLSHRAAPVARAVAQGAGMP